MGLDLLRARRGGARALVAPLALLLAAGLPGSEAGAAPDEAELEAALVYKFLRFVRWPEGTGGDEVTLCALDAPAVADALETITGARDLDGRALSLRRIAGGEDAAGCQVLFVGRKGGADLGALLRRLEGRPVLTVSDRPDFARRGGMIGLYRRGDRMRFAVNLRAAEAAGLAISSRLLELARVVKD